MSDDEAEEGFDEGLYLATNPDLAGALDGGLIESGRDHWREIGRAETRAGRRPTLRDMAGDPNAFLLDEPRIVAELATLDGFDAAAYLAMNPDLALAYGTDQASACRHLVEYGRLEGRVAPGDAPHSARRVSVNAVLGRPFGVDLYLPVSETSGGGVAGRHLLAAMRAASIPVLPRCYDEKDRRPGINGPEWERPGAHRVSLIVADPAVLRRLLRLYRPGHFDDSYVIGYWPHAGLAPHMPQYATFGAVDEVWVSSPALRDLLCAVAPVPVRNVALPPLPLPRRGEARRLLGMAADAQAVMVDAALVDDGTGGLVLPPHVGAMIRQRAESSAPQEGRAEHRRLLVVRADARAAHLLDREFAPDPDILVFGDQRHHGGGSLVLGACDALVVSPGIDADIADAQAGGITILETDSAGTLAVSVRHQQQARPQAASAAGTGGRILELLTALGLTIEAPVFGTLLGRSRHASTAAPPPDAPLGNSYQPILSLILDGRPIDRATIERLAASLNAQPYPHWELCAASADGARFPGGRGGLPHDPRIRVHVRAIEEGGTSFAGRSVPGMAEAFNKAASLATGVFLLPVSGDLEGEALIRRLDAIALRLSQHDRPDVLVRRDPAASSRARRDSVEGGGPSGRPVAIERRRFLAAGGFRAAYAPALGFDLMLRLARTDAVIEQILDEDDPHDADLSLHPAWPDAARRALLDHGRIVAGPGATVEAGLGVTSHRLRRYLPGSPSVTVVALGPVAPALEATLRREERVTFVVADTVASVARAAIAAATEHLVLLDDRIANADEGAILALRELLADEGIGAAGGLILHQDGTLHHAGLIAEEGGTLKAPGHGQPLEATGGGDFARRVRNVDAVSGCIAVRRSLLLELGNLEHEFSNGGTARFDYLTAYLCNQLGDRGRRIVYTPFARFSRSRPAASAA